MKFNTIQAILAAQGINIVAKDDEEVTVGELPVKALYSLKPQNQ